ncbi:MAG TPA: hypothetical protein VMT15_05460 [Bryobacteraceae bacterium]|nr:hypothetical protein [Bryobacteraceae bacterium]
MPDREARPLYERFAVPHQFQPRLTLHGAALAVAAALVQILFGCLIASLWGVGIWLAAVSTHSVFWKCLAILGCVAGMAVCLGGLVWLVQAAVGRLTKRNAGDSSVASPAQP